MSDRVHGTCSLCKGAVTTPEIWSGVQPPTPTCSSCGATPMHQHGPIIQMERKQADGFTVQDLGFGQVAVRRYPGGGFGMYSAQQGLGWKR